MYAETSITIPSAVEDRLEVIISSVYYYQVGDANIKTSVRLFEITVPPGAMRYNRPDVFHNQK